MALPVGSWNISTDTLGNGSLSITSVDSSGNVEGTISVTASRPIVGWFDATSQTVSLATVTDPTTEFFVFLGNLFQLSSSTGTPASTEAVLAGTYDGFPPGVATAASGRWVASVSEKGKEKEKDTKESKDTKEVKDTKEGKEKEGLEKVSPDVPLQGPAATDPEAMMRDLAMRLDAVEQHLGIERPFISAEERPDVGGHALGTRNAG
jgi:hypothetical protein